MAASGRNCWMITQSGAALRQHVVGALLIS
ncbi:MAG: hypothetical protein ING75_11200 [Rhodocyclaceae bacterium]|nr:hypothetical protein [Rhodocyclaceae bacterium]